MSRSELFPSCKSLYANLSSFVTAMMLYMNILSNYGIWLGIIYFIPMVAAKNEQPFPDIPFQAFAKFVENNFNSAISLSTVLMILFSITENTTLLSLHARQQKAHYRGEISSATTGWINCLSREILQRVMARGEDILTRLEASPDDKLILQVSLKLEALAKLLNLHPYSKKGKFMGKLKPVSHNDISPVHIICPNSIVCESMSCNPRSLLQHTKIRDIPLVTLIKNFVSYEQVPLLSGHCPNCKTVYYADHETTPTQHEDKSDRVYLNSAVYIKIGQSLWVDRLFTSAVLGGIYNFHASAATYAEFWNMSFESPKVARRQIWQAFVQESLRMQAAESRINFTMEDGATIDDVTREAFRVLGNEGVISGSMQHSCNECTQKYRERSTPSSDIDPSAIVGIDDNLITPQFQTTIVEDCAPVKMVIVDGIVTGHTVSLYMEFPILHS